MASNPKPLNHWVSTDKHCYDRIKAKVFYYGTDDCSDLCAQEFPQEQITGMFPAADVPLRHKGAVFSVPGLLECFGIHLSQIR
jgi:hypothetical protein